MPSDNAFFKSKKIILQKIDDAYKQNRSWSAANFPPGSDKPALTEEQRQEKGIKKRAYIYDDIDRFKVFLEKHKNESLKLIMPQEDDFIKAMDDFQAENKKIMTPDMQAHVNKIQFLKRRRYRRVQKPAQG